MSENENLVLDGTENVEGTTTEETVEQVTEPVKTYTEEEVNQIVGKKIARERAKIQKENKRTYGRLEHVLKAGMGGETIEEMTNSLEKFYTDKGISIPKEPTYSNKDIEVLAKAEADEIISSGFEDVIEEADRLRDIGAERMTAREKALFVKLTDHIKNTETGRELSKLGVTEDVYKSDDFKSFAKKFEGSKTPIKEIYEIYNKTQPKKEIKTMGSMKHAASDKSDVKDFYSYEEAQKFSREDFDKNPALYDAVQKSMLKW